MLKKNFPCDYLKYLFSNLSGAILDFSKEDIVDLEGHSQYVDICKWNPQKAILMTASSDQTCYLWDCQDVSKYFHENQRSTEGNKKNKTRPSVSRSSLQHSSVTESYSVTCADWSHDGKMLAIGTNLWLFIKSNYVIKFSLVR